MQVTQAPRFTASPSFYNDLKRRVNTYFEENKKKQTGNWQLYSKALILLTLQFGIYITLVFFTPSTFVALALCVVLGFVTAGIGFNVMHDGAHGSFSRNKIINKMAAFSLNLMGGSDYMWNIKHNNIHHSFTNVDGVDDDIDIRPWLRMCETQAHHRLHRFQHIYFVFFYAMMYFFWIFYLDYRKYFRGYIGVVKISDMNLRQHLVFWGSKLGNLTLFVILPVAMLGWAQAAIGFFVFVIVTGFVISIVFQLAHTVEHTEFPVPVENNKLENEWAIHQIQTTANFATHNPIITWFCGGLNFQIEHHLFPKISHIHYPAISRIVKEACRDYNLHYIEFPKMTAAIASHVRLLRGLGQMATA